MVDVGDVGPRLSGNSTDAIQRRVVPDSFKRWFYLKPVGRLMWGRLGLASKRLLY